VRNRLVKTDDPKTSWDSALNLFISNLPGAFVSRRIRDYSQLGPI
jgi:hypothetical protein